MQNKITNHENENFCGTSAFEEINYTDTTKYKSIVKIINSEFDIKSGKQLFRANCTSCHAMDKKLIGPALANVINRIPSKPANWLELFIQDSNSKIMKKDKYLQKLKKESDDGEYPHKFYYLYGQPLKDLIGYILIYE